jgi:hypothetical protein
MPSICDAALARQSISSNVTRFKSDLRWLKLVNSENYAEFKQSASAAVPDYFTGNYDEFEKKRSTLMTQESLSLSIDDARSSFMAYFPREAYAAWRDCVVANGGSELLVGAYDGDEAGATIVICWKPVEASYGRLSNTSVRIDGGRIVGSDTFSGQRAFVGEAAFIVQRTSPGATIGIVVSGKTQSGMSVQGNCKLYTTPPPNLESWKRSFGQQNRASFNIPLKPRPRNLQVTVTATQTMEQWGDPWHSLAISVDGAQTWYRRNGTQPGTNYLANSFVVSVPAGHQTIVEGTVENYRTRNDDLSIEARELS